MAQRQLITFQLGQQVLGVDIMAIREIRAWSPATPLPNVPAHVRGVVNLRGVVLPVLDLSQLIGWGQTEPSVRHVIIVVQVAGQLQGLMVDAVNDIVSIDLDALQPPPGLGATNAPYIVEGIATVDDRMVMVLALSRLSDECCNKDGFWKASGIPETRSRPCGNSAARYRPDVLLNVADRGAGDRVFGCSGGALARWGNVPAVLAQLTARIRLSAPVSAPGCR